MEITTQSIFSRAGYFAYRSFCYLFMVRASANYLQNKHFPVKCSVVLIHHFNKIFNKVFNNKPNTMNTRIASIKNFGDKLSVGKGSFPSLVNRSIIILLFGLFFVSGIHAQTVMSYESVMLSLELDEAAHLNRLATDLHTTAYLMQGENTTYGEGPTVVAICDAASLSMLYGNNPDLNQVELVRIAVSSLNELPTSIDLNRLNNLTNLKYLFVVFEYDACGSHTDGCLASIVEGLIKGTSSQITVVYTLSIPQ